MPFFNQFLPVFSIALTLITIIGGYAAFRQGKGKQSGEIQDQAINALKARIEALEGQVESDKRTMVRQSQELAHHRQVLSTIRVALKRRGLSIEIDGEYVTIVDAAGAQSTQGPRKGIKPIRLTSPVDEDDDDGDAV